MKPLKKFLIYNLIFVMIFTLCSCGKKPEPIKGETVNEQTSQGQEGISTVEDMIEKYHANSTRNVKAYLLLGIDKSGEAVSAGASYGGGQSDGIYVIAVDEDNRKTTVLQINRDTCVNFTITDVFGNPMTTKEERLALVYATGSGMEDSCEKSEAVISDLLHGLKFDGYAAIYYDAIAPVVDTLGGVNIYIEEDLSAVSEKFIQGETILMDGDDAYKFCRARTAVADQSNTGRMRRQRTFLTSFLSECRSRIKGESNIINDMYNASSPFLVSNLSQAELINIAAKALSYSDGGIVTPAGREEWITGEDGITFGQFYVDEKNLSTILEGVFSLEK